MGRGLSYRKPYRDEINGTVSYGLGLGSCAGGHTIMSIQVV